MSSRDRAATAPLGLVDAVAVGVLLTGLGLYVHFALSLGRRPEEDAAMLLRYAEHLARGHGIVWNQGEAPVDGATDFLFMLLVASLHRLGVGLETAAQSVGLASHALTVVGLYLGPRLLFGCAPPVAFLGGAFLAVGPGLRYVAASYGTPFFALWALVAVLLAARLALAAGTGLGRPALLFALASLGLGLARPEGVFLGGFLLLSILYARRGEGLGVIAGWYAGVFLTLGLTYFLWRWHYFGHPLPNPFYRKGAGVLYPYTLRKAWEDLWTLSLPFSAVVVGGLLVPRARRWAAFTAIPVALFVVLWILLSNETNYVMRFRYPVLPLVLVGWVPVAEALVGDRRWPARLRGGVGWVACIAVGAGLVAWQHQRYRPFEPRPMGLREAGVMLADYAPRAFSLVTTEAGLLPLYSGWRAVDAWGLNDAFIAHHGEVTEEYLDRYRPEVIVFHAFFAPDTPQEGPGVENRSLGPAWYRMVMTLKRYAESRDYVLAAVYGRHDRDTHWYYVRRGFPQSAEIVDRIRALDYPWDGEPTIDFAAGAHRGASVGRPVPVAHATRGALSATFRDNTESPRQLSGIDSLFNNRDAPGFDAFDPDARGASAGVNLEHIISGHRSPHNKFTPRGGRYTLHESADGRSFTLVRRAEDSPWKVDSTLTYTVQGPHYVDFEFRCTPRDAALFGPRGYAIFFFASYMNDVADTALRFRGKESADAGEVWISAEAPPGHPDWNEGGTYRSLAATDLECDDDVEFRLNTWSYEWPRITQPFFYGRAARDMTMILMFDRLHSERDEIRFSLFKFKLPRRPRPAWDFQYVVHRVETDEEYGFRGRLVWKTFVSPEDCRQEYERWAEQRSEAPAAR